MQKKSIYITVAVLIMLLSVAMPVMAISEGISAYASGSASAGSGETSAGTSAHASYTGALTTGYADVMSEAMGDEYAQSSSSAGGMVVPWVLGSVGGNTAAYAYGYTYDATAWTFADTGGDALYVPLSTSIDVNALAYGDDVSVEAGVETNANWDIAGIESSGGVSADTTGFVVLTGYYDPNRAYATSDILSEAYGNVYAYGEVSSDVWDHAEAGTNYALYTNGGIAHGSSHVDANLIATAYWEIP